ncbi:hypothetical protein FOZ60_011304 [Perkinsus olseni]|uniref:TIR domain-containing protein n=1 Tax=Perkinsus olseni TaxID=32597 RepID=A0A7J6PAX2_PEROL|nr:hypothetical protein FOZ60_011304 [Perkinsus olseni]
MVFLDKCCIPQNDPIAKSYGISRLADYLRVSNKLLILWSPDYLERLWCVYELAVFLRFHKKEDVILVNLNHLELCMSLMIVQSFSIVTLLLIEPWKPDLVYIVCGMAMIASVLVDRGALSCSEEWRKFRSEVKRFSVRRAKCSSSEDYDTLKQLITDMYGSEESFATVVRSIWLGEGEDNNHSTCLLSRTSLRVICAPYIPLLIARISWVITLLFPPQLDGNAVSLLPIYDVGVMREDLPSPLEVFMWELRTSIIPILMLCFRAPLMLLAGHKLATSSISERVAKWHLGIIHAIFFGAYIILTRVVCGWQNFYFPLRRGLMNMPMGEAIHWAYSVAAVTVTSSVLSKSYARNP